MTRKLRREHSRKCTSCGGKGVSPHVYPLRQCRACLGTGLVYVREERVKTDWLAELNARVDELRSEA
jgi:DnaJ-class molecular chaperone